MKSMIQGALLLLLTCGPGLATVDDLGKLRTAAKSDEGRAADWVKLGDALMQRTRDTVEHDFSEAKAAYGKALEMEGKHLGALVGMAWVKNSEHDFAAGAKWAHKALAMDSNCLHAHALLGDGAMELGEYDMASDHIQAALDIRADLSTLGRAAHLLWLTGDANRAQALMGRAARAGGPVPENEAWCRAELAMMQFHTGAMAASEQQAEAAMKLAPRNPRVLTAMGRIRAAQGRLDDAVKLYEESVSVNPTHEPLAELVSIHQLRGERDMAATRTAQLRKLYVEHHHDGSDHKHGGNSQLALFMAESGMDPKAALHEAEHAYEAFPNIKSADAVAWCAYRAGDLVLAKRMVRRALKYGTAEPSLHFHAGMIASALKDKSGAMKHLAHALSLNPDFDPVDADTAREELEKLRTADS